MRLPTFQRLPTLRVSGPIAILLLLLLTASTSMAAGGWQVIPSTTRLGLPSVRFTG